MSDQHDLQAALDEQAKAFEDFKKIHSQVLEESQKNGEATAEAQAKLEKCEQHLDEVGERIGKLEAQWSTSRFERQLDDNLTGEDRAHMDAFSGWLRAPKDPQAIANYKEATAAVARQQESNPQMAVTITTTGGGNAIPTEVAARMRQKIHDLTPMRRVANVVTVSNENTRFIVLDNNAAGGWVAAGSSRSETTTPTFQAFTLTYGTAYAYPQVYEEALNDLAMDVPAMIESQATRILASQEGAAFVSGNGTAKPTGFLAASTEVTTGDEASPARTFGVLQYFPTGHASDFQSDAFASPFGDPAGVLFDTVYGLKAEYRGNAAWMMNKATLAKIRKFRDKDGNYLYLPGLVAGQPANLLGFPIVEGEDMPDTGSNTFPVAFGDFDEGYQIGDIISSLRITVDDNITAPGFVKFYIRRRVGGNLANDDAIKVIKCAAS